MSERTAPLLEIGQHMGRYRIEALLGAGGMGVVYLAHDSELRRNVAIKLVDRPQPGRDSTRMLLEEARTTAALDHPAICSVHEVGLLGNEPYIVLEHIRGTPLSELIPRDRGLDVPTALRYATDIVDAIAYAHARGIVHGDLKASNVMVEPGGRVKVLDFGLAVTATEPGSAEVVETTSAATVSGAGAGTVPYMAPELLSGRRADGRSDVWALGVVMFEMLSGFRPFRGTTRYEVAAAILGGQAAALPLHVLPEVCAVVNRCLARDPAARYPSARELAAALDDLH